MKISSSPINSEKRKTEHKLGSDVFNTNLNELCPYHNIREYVMTRPLSKSEDEPFFVFQDGTPVGPNNLRNTLRKMLKLAGFKETNYGTHGFCTGRCLDLKRMNLDLECIKNLGRWRSNCVFSYLAYI